VGIAETYASLGGSHSGIAEHSCVLGRDTVWLDAWFPTFRNIIVQGNGLGLLEDGGTTLL
jgi:hypothetical protein